MNNYELLRDEMISFVVSKGFPRETIEKICITKYDLATIYEVLQYKRPKNICEIGSYIGISTCLFAMMTDAVVVTIDPNFSIAADVEEDGYCLKQKTGYYYDLLVRNYGLENRINRLHFYFSCTPSDWAVEFHGKHNPNLNDINIIGHELDVFKPFDLFFIDGDHSFECVHSDLKKALLYASDDSLFIVHDTQGFWGEQIIKGVSGFLKEHSEYNVEYIDNIGIIQKR